MKLPEESCETCFHEKTAGTEAPCNTCGYRGKSNWAAKSEVFWAEAPKSDLGQYLTDRIMKTTPAVKPLDVQVGGDHYKGLSIQPIEYIHANKMNYCEANVVKYITRWRDKGGVKDLEKVKHYVDLLIQLEGLKSEPPNP